MLARIFRPAKSAMQSGKAKTKDWVLEFEPASARRSDPLMGWTLTSDTNGQVRLSFETSEEARGLRPGARHRLPDHRAEVPQAHHQGLCGQLRLRPQATLDPLGASQRP